MATSARYWRILIQSYVNYPSIGELEFAAMGATKYTGTPIESSHFDASLVPANAFDGSLSTAWAPASTSSPWLGLDLGSAQQVDVVRIAGRDNGQSVTGFKVQSSPDNATWSDEWTVTGFGGQNRVTPFPRPDQGKVLWQLHVTAVESGATWAGSEIEFLQSSGGSDETAPGGKVSGTLATDPYSQAVDDNTATIFSSAVTADFVYEFTSAKAITNVAIRARGDINANQAAKDFTIRSSPDGMTYTTEYTVTGQTGWSLGERRVLPTPAASSGPTFRVAGFIG